MKKVLSENLKNARRKQRYTLQEVSELTGIAVSTIGNLESGLNKNPRLNTVLALSKVLKVPVSKLIK